MCSGCVCASAESQKNEHGSVSKPTGCMKESADGDRNAARRSLGFTGITCTELDLEVAGGEE